MTHTRMLTLSGFAAMLFGLAAPISAEQRCATLDASAKEPLIGYVQKKYKVLAPSVVRVTQDTVLDGCYHKLQFASDAPNRNFSVVLYLSPDRRFLAPDLFDSQSDPVAEERKVNLALQSALLKGDFASVGPADAPVTIIEFSDFQCPYCKQASQILHSALEGPDSQNVRLVFRHFPLSMHPWARPASEGAACVKFQSGHAFWKVHDYLFSNQTTITLDNIQPKLQQFVGTLPGIDLKSYQTCMDNAMSLGLVMKDTDLGTANQVRGTPTFFVNGKRVSGVRNAQELQALIAEAQREAAPAPAGPEGNR